MKKLFALAIALMTVLVLSACSRTPVIVIGVDSDTMGEALVAQFEADFPDSEFELEFRNYGSVNGENSGVQGIEFGQGQAPDVALVIDNEVLGRQASLLRLPTKFNTLGQTHTHPTVFEEINFDHTYYLPAFYDGMAFSWNKTMLEEFGIDVTDLTANGLPAELDTWEKIFALADTWGTDNRPEFDGNEIEEIFPISLSEVWSGYSPLTAGGWKLFGDGTDYTDPNFNDPAFLSGLEFIKAFSEAAMSVDETGNPKIGEAMGWRWEQYLEGAFPMGLVGTWMNVDEAITETGYEFMFSPMPTWQDNQLRPLMKTKGFVVNAYTDHEEYALEVLEWLYTKDTMETMINNSAYLPALQEGAIFPDVDAAYKVPFALAMLENELEIVGTLPNAPTVRAMDVYYSIGVGDFLIDVYDGELTPEAAQTAIHSAADAWIEANNVAD